MADNLPKPASRKEQYLAKIAGEDTEIPEKPESRVEQYLAKIAENGGGGGGGPTVVQTTGNSQSDVMSQDATTKLVYKDSSNMTRVQIGQSANAGSNNSVVIGDSTEVTAGSTVAIGRSAHSNKTLGIAIGAYSHCGNSDSVALGSYSETNKDAQIHIGVTNSNHGYNNTNYRLLSGVHDPVDAHDAATKGYVDAQGGGGGPTVVQTTGTSTTDVMSQDATTKLIYPDIANNPYQILIGGGYISGTNKGVAINGALGTGINSSSIAIGAPDGNFASIGSNGRANSSIAIGNTAAAGRGMQSIAIGYNSYTNSGQDNGDNIALGSNTYAGNNSVTNTVALGAYAKTTRTGEVNIGAGTSGAGYNSTNYRVLGGVHDPVDAHDAATKGYVDANAGGSAVFYMSVNPFATASGVSLYSDSGLTTAVPASTFVQALRNCKSVFLVHQNGTDTERAQIVCSNTPNQDTASAYDDTYPTARYFDDNGNYIMMQSTTGDPTDIASFDIAT